MEKLLETYHRIFFLDLRPWLTANEQEAKFKQRLAETPKEYYAYQPNFDISFSKPFSSIRKYYIQLIDSEELGYYIRFKQKKTKGQETLPISADAVSILGERLSHEEAVFQNLTYSEYNNQKIREWITRAGINKHITFHCARHTYATLQLTLGTDIYTVSKLLGHRDIKTTQVYAKIIDEKKVEAANRIKLF